MMIILLLDVPVDRAADAMELLRVSATNRDAAGVADLFHRQGIAIESVEVVDQMTAIPVRPMITDDGVPLYAVVNQQMAAEALATAGVPLVRRAQADAPVREVTFLDGKVRVTDQDGKGAVTWDVDRPVCPHCNEIQCCYMCDGSVSHMEDDAELQPENEEDVMNRLLCNGALDGIETLVHCLVVTGAVRSEDPAVNQALRLALASVSMQ